MKQKDFKALERVPGSPFDAEGGLLVGTYEGAIASTSYEGMSGVRARVMRVRQEKAWQWWGVIDEEMAAGSAIIRLGYVAQLFFWCLDRRTGELWCDHEVTREPWQASISWDPMAEEVARFGRGEARCVVTRRGWKEAAMRGEFPGEDVRWAVEMSEAVPPMTAICPVKQGIVNVTVKQAGARATGEIHVGGRTWVLGEGAQGMLDYTHGLLARETSWRWAIGCGVLQDGRAVSFNMVAGFNQGLENVCWIEGVLHALGYVTVECEGDGERGGVWRVRGEHVELELEIEGVRRATKDLGVAASHYVQPVGRWSGRVAGEVLGEVSGVAEDHQAKW